MTRILHIAPFNTAGVPLELVRAEQTLGFDSRLVTLSRSRQKFEEDICLDLPLLDHWSIRLAKKLFSPQSRMDVSHEVTIPAQIPRIWKPNRPENILIKFREKYWQNRINSAIKKYHLLDFDIYQLDGGLEFYRDARIIRKLKALGKKIVCCYTGSDLRVRGVIPEIDALSDCNVSVEFDHQFLHPNLTHVPFPINPDRFQRMNKSEAGKLKITHAPTNRKAKGSDIIIPIVQQLEKEYPIELLLIENLPYREAIAIKAQSDIFIDQIGDLGYGISGIEALCMGIPTCSCVAPGFEKVYPDHPFILIDKHNLRTQLIQLIENKAYRDSKADEGYEWVKRVHHSQAVVQKIHHLAGIH
jgi:hypothetical protein